jgi:hypothetical protein
MRTINVNENLSIVVEYEENEKLRKESGWWITRAFNPKTLSWVDHAKPGYGVTYWVNKEIAKKFNLQF